MSGVFSDGVHLFCSPFSNEDIINFKRRKGGHLMMGLPPGKYPKRALI